jgi:flavin-dependent dehydrogenase
MNSFDVIVVGAGPSGLLAAGRAAELGGGGGTKDFYFVYY